eukprot:scaffold495_cov152-Skeletonema_menzelii.AAC.4
MSSSNDRKKEYGLRGGKISSWAPAAAAIASTTTKTEDLSIGQNVKSSECPHLEQLMFPKFLSLDCNQLDEFCMGRVADATNAGRLYIEALHLKDFLKDTDALNKQYNKKGKNKRASPSRAPSKKKSRGADAKDVADDKALSQTIWGGLEGKRTWILSNSDRGIAGYSPMVPQTKSSQEGDPILHEFHEKKSLLDTESSEDALRILLNSELRLRTLQKTFQLHDKTAMFDNYVCNTSDDSPPQDHELNALKVLAKPLPNAQPVSLQNTNPKVTATAPVVPSLTSEQDTATNDPMDAEEKISETASPQKITTEVTASTEQVGADEVMTPSRSEDPTVLLSPEKSATIESGGKTAEVASPKGISDENKVAVGQASSETPAVENPRELLAVSLTPSSKQAVSPVAPKAIETQRPIPALLNETAIEETAETLHNRAVHEGKDASFAANKMLSSFRQNRRKFWTACNNSEMKCVWCSSSDEACMKSAKNLPVQEFGVIKDARVSKKWDHCDNELISHASGDNLIQCLECDLIGCRSGFVGGKSHAMLHFLMSGHTYGVTCGSAGQLFCMRCGDIVQHECFDRERERESPINRGINPSSFTVTKEQGHFALRRALMFRGCSTSNMTTLGPNALKLTMHRQAHTNDRPINTPVGLYNLGNTCYMNSTLQCLINCAPLQEAFLTNLTNPYQCCETLKAGETSCLACEIDKLFLEYFGSSVGIDAIAALEEQRNALSNALDTNAVVLNEPNPEYCGHPVIPSNFLAKVWKHSTVTHLARHDQHDAQEFYHAVIDVLDADVLSYQKRLRSMQQTIEYKSQIRTDKTPTNPPQSCIKDIFEGSLRSVLICDLCGCKRSQIESFLNLSLPLKNEFPSESEVAAREQMTTRRETSNIHACLNHFTDPETLSDPIYCPSCNRKTKTLKQHTFAKLPRILCLHLKRFDAATNKKINDFVSYPASDLDMGKYLPHWCEKVLSKEGKESDSNQLDAESPKVLYDLFATVNHRGTLNQGHYTSNIKCGDHWYHCNDAFVCYAGEGNGEKEVLLAEGAYMLFYLRKDGK